jgi:hypothetical protein
VNVLTDAKTMRCSHYEPAAIHGLLTTWMGWASWLDGACPSGVEEGTWDWQGQQICRSSEKLAVFVAIRRRLLLRAWNAASSLLVKLEGDNSVWMGFPWIWAALPLLLKAVMKLFLPSGCQSFLYGLIV